MARVLRPARAGIGRLIRRTRDWMQTHFPDENEEDPAARDRLRRITPAILLTAVAAVCWAVTARRMQGMDMGPATDLGGLGWFAVVWATMMAAMMLPSLVPMALTCAGPSREAGASSPPPRAASSPAATSSPGWVQVSWPTR